MPSHNQTLATSALVSALDLGDGGFERLKPDDTINPALQRFYTTLLHRAINPGAPVRSLHQLPFRDVEIIIHLVLPLYSNFVV